MKILQITYIPPRLYNVSHGFNGHNFSNLEDALQHIADELTKDTEVMCEVETQWTDKAPDVQYAKY